MERHQLIRDLIRVIYLDHNSFACYRLAFENMAKMEGRKIKENVAIEKLKKKFHSDAFLKQFDAEFFSFSVDELKMLNLIYKTNVIEKFRDSQETKMFSDKFHEVLRKEFSE